MPENQDRQDTQAQWYVVHTYSGYENKVKANLEKTVNNNSELAKLILEVTIPVEEVEEIKNNKRRIVQHKLLPGYVMVRMILTNETWYIVRNTRGVTGFVGPGSKPEPLSQEDFESLTKPQAATSIDIQVGDEVKILQGSFEGQIGKIISMDSFMKTVQVAVSVFKREITVDLAYDEVVHQES